MYPQQPQFFGMMPSQWPGYYPQILPQQSQQISNEVPARVKVAIHFLNDLTYKQMDRAAISDVSIQVLDGKRLNMDEERAQESALSMLRAYFDGDLLPSEWERAYATRDLQSPVRCSNCEGSGKINIKYDEHERPVSCEVCPSCGGSGILLRMSNLNPRRKQSDE